jgi:hypothetical protein
MRYRMEMADDLVMIRNVEADVEVGAISRLYDPDPTDPNRMNYAGCKIYSGDGREIVVTALTPSGSCDLLGELFTVVSTEKALGYPSFKASQGCPDPLRIEHRLGTLMADAACALACAYTEQKNGGVEEETKQKYGELMNELFEIYWASSFQSFNAERNAWEPYFSNAPPWDPRMTFPEAAQHYGMFHMGMRFRHIDEAALKELLSCVLELLNELIKSLFPPIPHRQTTKVKT